MKLILITLFLTTVLTVPKLRVNVESLCPDSRTFIKNHYSTCKETKELVVELVFLGKIKEVNNTFECQHGEEECIGNAALISIRNSSLSPEKKKYAIIAFFASYDGKNIDKALETALKEQKEIVSVKNAIVGNNWVTLLKDERTKLATNGNQVLNNLKSKPVQQQQSNQEYSLAHVPSYDLICDNGKVLHNDEWFNTMQTQTLEFFVKLSETECKYK